MQTINCYIPLKLRLRGEPGEDDWNSLEEVLVAGYTSALKRSVKELTKSQYINAEMREDIQELFAPERAIPEGYLIPGYEDGKPTAVPTQSSETATAASGSTYTPQQVYDLVRQTFPSNQGKSSTGVYYGAYVLGSQDGLRLYYITFDEKGNAFVKFRKIHKIGDEQAIPRYPAGIYTFIARGFGKAKLYRGGREVQSIENPENATISIEFIVPESRGTDINEEIVVYAHRYRFYPRLQILSLNQEQAMTTGSLATYIAHVEIWRVDEKGIWSPLYGLAWPYAFLHYKWDIWKVTPAAENKPEHRDHIDTIETRGPSLEYRWEEEGTYEIQSEVTLTYEDASPLPVTDKRRDTVRLLELKMALVLALSEKQQEERQAGKDPLWFQSANEFLEHYRHLLELETQAKLPNEARINTLKEMIAKMEKQLLGQTTAGPFPIPAIFTERRTSQTRLLNLFVGPAKETESGKAHTWQLIDLTYPAFYQTYTGSGATPEAAIHEAFERSRKSIRNKYPPGLILADLNWPGMEKYGAKRHNFSIGTESSEKTAYEWLSTGAQVIGAIGLVASLLFPPSAILTAVLIIGTVAGVAVSAWNIIERVNTNSFSWDVETFSDIANIAASFAFLASAGIRSAASGVARSIASGEQVTLASTSKLSTLLRAERAMLYTAIAADTANSLVLAWDTFEQLKDLDSTFGTEMLEQYKKLYGEEEGAERFRNERYIRILGLLARAAVSGTLAVISIQGSRERLGQVKEQQAALGGIGGGPESLGQPAGEAEPQPQQGQEEKAPATEQGPSAAAPSPAAQSQPGTFERLEVHTIPDISKEEVAVLRRLDKSVWTRILNAVRGKTQTSSIKGRIAEELFVHTPEFAKAQQRAREMAAKEGIPPDSIKFVQDIRAMAPKERTSGALSALGDGAFVAIQGKRVRILTIFESKSPSNIRDLAREGSDMLGQIARDFERLRLEGETITIDGQRFRAKDIQVSRNATEWLAVIPPGMELTPQQMRDILSGGFNFQEFQGPVRDPILNDVAQRVIDLANQ